MATAKKPMPRLRRVFTIVAAALCGCALGAGIFGFGYSELPSYLGSAPETCANCHVMQEYYDAWSRGPHHNVATCDDCHLPHGNVIQQYSAQLSDGMLHSYKFTTGDYPTNIVIRQSSLDIVNQSCLTCHDNMTAQIRASMTADGDSVTCSRCHSHIGHD